MARLIWSEQSVDDLRSIAEFIAKDSVKFAKLTVSKIRTTARYLIEHPYIGKVVTEIGKKEIREMIIGNYRLIYKVNIDKTVEIITVHHSAKQLYPDIIK